MLFGAQQLDTDPGVVVKNLKFPQRVETQRRATRQIRQSSKLGRWRLGRAHHCKDLFRFRVERLKVGVVFQRTRPRVVPSGLHLGRRYLMSVKREDRHAER